MKIYVSGNTGLVGSNVVKALKKSGHEVYTTFLKTDLLNPKDLENLQIFLEVRDIDLVIHCAGKVGGIKANSNHIFNTSPVDLMDGLKEQYEDYLRRIKNV